MKQYDDLIAALRVRLPEYMAQRGQVIGSKGNRLIHCINPSHRDSTPSMSYYPKAHTLRCFGCGKSYDLFDVIALDYPECDSFPKQVRQACRLFDLTFPEDFGRPMIKVTPGCAQIKHLSAAVTGEVMADVFPPAHQAIQANEPVANNTPDFTEWIEQALAQQSTGGDYFRARGISDALCQKYKLFEKDGRAYLPVYENGRCICYTGRAIDPALTPRYKNSTGTMQLFGLEQLSDADAGGVLVVTESVFDALSAEICGYRAVSLCGAGNVPRFLRWCEQNAAIANRYLFIMAGDTDDAGQRMNQALQEGLHAQGLSCAEIVMPEGCKDLNEALVNARGELEAAFAAAVDADAAAYRQTNAAAALAQMFDENGIRARQQPVATGSPALDTLLDGGLYPGLYAIGAISSLGKTSFLLQMADSIAAEGTDVLFFSLEMGKFELLAKSLSRLSSGCDWSNGSVPDAGTLAPLTAREVLRGSELLLPARKTLLRNAAQRYRAGVGECLFIREGVGELGTQEIRQAVGEHIRLRGRRPVVMLDYLQILKPADPRATSKQNIDSAVVELKRISRDFDLPVVMVSSFNRENYHNAVTMEAFKESGAVEYSCDVLFGMQLAGAGEAGFDLNAAKSCEPRGIELVLLKNRSGIPYARLPYHYYARVSAFAENTTRPLRSRTNKNKK